MTNRRVEAGQHIVGDELAGVFKAPAPVFREIGGLLRFALVCFLLFLFFARKLFRMLWPAAVFPAIAIGTGLLVQAVSAAPNAGPMVFLIIGDLVLLGVGVPVMYAAVRVSDYYLAGGLPEARVSLAGLVRSGTPAARAAGLSVLRGLAWGAVLGAGLTLLSWAAASAGLKAFALDTDPSPVLAQWTPLVSVLLAVGGLTGVFLSSVFPVGISRRFTRNAAAAVCMVMVFRALLDLALPEFGAVQVLTDLASSMALAAVSVIILLQVDVVALLTMTLSAMCLRLAAAFFYASGPGAAALLLAPVIALLLFGLLRAASDPISGTARKLRMAFE